MQPQFDDSITARQLINQLAVALRQMEADKLLPKREQDPPAFRAERKRGLAIIRREIARKVKEEVKAAKLVAKLKAEKKRKRKKAKR